jgi:hypothetical protein
MSSGIFYIEMDAHYIYTYILVYQSLIYTYVYVDFYVDPYITTGNSCFFAECMKHSTKPGKHSVKALSSVTTDKKVSVNCTSATTSLSSTFCQALDKVFVECHLVLDKEKSPSHCQVTATETVPSAMVTLNKGSLFFECLLYWRSAKKLPVGPFASSFAERIRRHSAKAPSLPSACRTSTRQRDHQWA